MSRLTKKKKIKCRYNIREFVTLQLWNIKQLLEKKNLFIKKRWHYIYDLVPIMYIILLVEDKLRIFNTINITSSCTTTYKNTIFLQ